MQFENLIPLAGFNAKVTLADPEDGRVTPEVVAEGPLDVLDKVDGYVIFTVGGMSFRIAESYALTEHEEDPTLFEFMNDETGEVFVLDVDSESTPRGV